MKTIQEAANYIGVDPKALWAMIQLESRHNPHAVNPYSGAIGLIQFMDGAAQDLGYRSAEELYNANKTYESQLALAARWFKRYAPYRDSGDFYLQTFYPAARRWKDRNTEFSALVQSQNPGIKSPQDYIDKVDRLKRFAPSFLNTGFYTLIAAGVGLILWHESRRK